MLSYSGITNYGKVVLPSVDSWGTNMNILKDPPKSVMTRRIDKVGDNMDIINKIGESGDRYCEAVSVYARGVNPSVSVEYSNIGQGNCKNGKHTGEAYLPYRIMRDGVFRPPILTQDKLLPLSRLPRNTTQVYTQKKKIDYSKKVFNQGGDYRSVKKQTIKACVRPTRTYKIETQATKPYEVKNVIVNRVKTSGDSGVRTRDLTTQVVKIPTGEITDRNLMENVYANKGTTSFTKYNDATDVSTVKYIQNSLSGEMNTNKGTESNVKYHDATDVSTIKYIQDTLDGNIDTNKGTECNVKYIDTSNFNTDKYTHSSTLTGDVYTNKLHPYTGSSAEYVNDANYVNQSIRDIESTSFTPLKTGNTKEDYINTSVHLENNKLLTEAYTNKNDPNKYVRTVTEHQRQHTLKMPMTEAYSNTRGQPQNKNTTTVVNLKPKISSLEGYAPRITKPSKIVNSEIHIKENYKTNMKKQTNQMFQSRFN